jgi:hypothetical protein
MKALLVAFVALSLLGSAGTQADTPLSGAEQSDVLDALVTIRREAEDMQRIGATPHAADLLARLDELKPVSFWKEATGVVDTPMVVYGRWKAGGKDYAYHLPGAGESLFVTDEFFQLRNKQVSNYNLQRMQFLEQASILLHENMHLHHAASEAEAYSEQYKWLRVMGMQRDGTMNGVPNGVSGPRVSVVMQTVLDQLKANGVDVETLEKSIQVPALSFTWQGKIGRAHV